jgi:predicted DCC family thiol-disulfide oxidoreductase YuxK
MAKVLAWDRRGVLRPVAIQSREGEHLLAGMSEERRMASWHLVTNYGEVRSAGGAAPHLLRRLPGGRPLAAVAAMAPGPTARAYELIAENRGRLGKLIGRRAKARADARIAAHGGG